MGVHLIPEVFKDQDTVFHYCSLNTAIEYILHEKRLRLSPRQKSKDPIENIIPTTFYSGTMEKDRSSNRFRTNYLKREMYTQAKQLCFCKNGPVEEFQGYGIKPEEYFGFLKPRMWDQYGANYNGVCLAFSLKSLKKKGKGFLFNPVEYVGYNVLKLSNPSIDIHSIATKGLDDYWPKYSQLIEKIMFRKHLDYQGENEYRIISFSRNDYDYINIEKCIVGMIVPDKYRWENSFAKEILLKYSKKLKAELLYLKWDVHGISITPKTQAEDFEKSIKEVIQKTQKIPTKN